MEGQTYVKVKIKPNVESSFSYEVYMKISSDLPRTIYLSFMDADIRSKFCRISLADPEFCPNEPLAMEIGADLYG